MEIKKPKARTKKPATAKKVFEGKIFSVYQWPQKMFDNSTAVFESLERAATVTIIPISNDGQIILTKQEQPCMKPFLSLPGGIVDAGEAVFLAAERELLEETGYLSEDWEFYFSSQPSGKIDWSAYVFIAKNCKFKTDPNLDAGEKIQVELIDFSEFLEIIRRKDFRNQDIALHYFRMNERERLEFKELLTS